MTPCHITTWTFFNVKLLLVATDRALVAGNDRRHFVPEVWFSSIPASESNAFRSEACSYGVFMMIQHIYICALLCIEGQERHGCGFWLLIIYTLMRPCMHAYEEREISVPGTSVQAPFFYFFIFLVLGVFLSLLFPFFLLFFQSPTGSVRTNPHYSPLRMRWSLSVKQKRILDSGLELYASGFLRCRMS